MSNKGFIPISRKLLDNPLWKQERTFSLFEAWFDLIVSARFEKDNELVILPNGIQVTIKRGQMLASQRYLEKRWGWSRGKVRKWLDNWEKAHQIAIDSASGQTLITLCNYDTYNTTQTNEKPTDRTTNRTNRSPVEAQQKPKLKELNKVNNLTNKQEGEVKRKTYRFSPPPLLEVEDYFFEKLQDQVSSKKQSEKFFNHYEANGWMVGKNKMKNWKAAVSGWINRQNEFEKEKSSAKKEKENGNTEDPIIGRMPLSSYKRNLQGW